MKQILCFIFIISLIVSCGSEEDKEELKSYPFVYVQQRDITGYQRFPASLEGTVDVEIRPKINGFLEEIFIDEGQRVTQGDVLFKLETRSLKGEVEAAYAMIATKKAKEEAAFIEVQKLIPLVKKGIISEINLKTAQANLAEARSELSEAQNTYESLKEEMNYQYVYTSVSGIVGDIPYRQGTLIDRNQARPLTVVSKIDSLFVYFSINESDYFSFLNNTAGSDLQQKIDNFPEVMLELPNQVDYSETGKIQTTTGQINASTGTATFRAIFPNSNGILNSGNSGVIKIPNIYKKALLIPKQSLVEEQSKSYVYKITAGDTVKKTLIETNRSIGNLLLVNKGLQEDDKVVVAGLGQIEDKVKIKPVVKSFDSVANSIDQVFR